MSAATMLVVLVWDSDLAWPAMDMIGLAQWSPLW